MKDHEERENQKDWSVGLFPKIQLSRVSFPAWLKRPLPSKGEIAKIKEGLRGSNLHTVCESARCPNIGDCFSRKTATYMINGNVCTRVCGFCDVKSGRPLPLNPKEPVDLAESAAALGLKYVVVTAVNRDDLKDGGAHQFAKVAEELRKRIPGVGVEFLIPDFNGDFETLKIVLEAEPNVINHNLETVRRLTPEVRSKAKYDRSLELLNRVATYSKSKVKTGLMLGLGEEREEVLEAIEDAGRNGCEILTLGQYLRPTEKHLSVSRYLEPWEFEDFKEKALKIGIPTVFSGPFVRSSFHAGEVAEMNEQNTANSTGYSSLKKLQCEDSSERVHAN